MPKPAWRERKEKYLEHLKTASASVLRISLADKLHNARSILRDLRKNGAETWDLFKGGKPGTMWYYRSLHQVYQERCPGYMADELGRVLAEIEKFAEM